VSGQDGAAPPVSGSPADTGVRATLADAGTRDAAPSEPAGDASVPSSLDAGALAPSAQDAASETPDGATRSDAAVVGSEGFLLVAELAEGKEAIHAYSLPELQHTGQLDGVKLASHLGAIALRDGRVITADQKRGQIIAIGIDEAGVPSIVNRVDADLGEGSRLAARRRAGRNRRRTRGQHSNPSRLARPGGVTPDGVLYITTAPGTGFDGVSVQMPFARTKLIPWDVDGLTTGRNARPRLSVDGRYIYGAIARTTPEGAALWAERAADLHVSDVEGLTAKRSALTTGVVSKFQLSSKYALLANVSGSGNTAILVDVQPGSSTFQQVVARVPLDALGNGPVAGQETTGKEALGSAITPDGKWAFVSHGGDGKVSVIDTASKTVARVLQTPTSLAGGGYLFALQRGVAPTDTRTR
jgi:hypothetical protein